LSAHIPFGDTINFEASSSAAEAIARIGRTEDVRFSPSGKRLAVAGYIKNQIAVFDIEIDQIGRQRTIRLAGGVTIQSPDLDKVHGIDFLDEDTLITANRGSGVLVFRIPPAASDFPVQVTKPIRNLVSDGIRDLDGPGSVTVESIKDNLCSVLICNNYSNTVSQVTLDAGSHHGPVSSGIFQKKWIDVPDGVSYTHDRQLIAVSIAGSGSVFLFPNDASASPDADPVGILRQVFYPHGLGFSGDNSLAFVADAGAPFVRVFSRPEHGWSGVHSPVASIRVMDQETFQRGAVHPSEGGPKGLDVHAAAGVLVVSCEYVPLAFFDVSALLDTCVSSARGSMLAAAEGNVELTDPATEVRYELRMRAIARTVVEGEVSALKRRRSWRFTAPLRAANQFLRRQ